MRKGSCSCPFFFWLTLLLAHTWIHLMMAGASRQQGNDLLGLFYSYPDRQAFWLGLALGAPALIGLLLTGYRARWPLLWLLGNPKLSDCFLPEQKLAE